MKKLSLEVKMGSISILKRFRAVAAVASVGMSTPPPQLESGTPNTLSDAKELSLSHESLLKESVTEMPKSILFGATEDERKEKSISPIQESLSESNLLKSNAFLADLASESSSLSARSRTNSRLYSNSVDENFRTPSLSMDDDFLSFLSFEEKDLNQKAYDQAMNFVEICSFKFTPQYVSKVVSSYHFQLKLRNIAERHLLYFELFKELLSSCNDLDRNDFWNSLPVDVKNNLKRTVIVPKLKERFVTNFKDFELSDFEFLCFQNVVVDKEIEMALMSQDIPEIEKQFAIKKKYKMEIAFTSIFETAVKYNLFDVIKFLIKDYKENLDHLKQEHNNYNCWNIVAQHGNIEVFSILIDSNILGQNSIENYEGVNLAFIAAKNNHMMFLNHLYLRFPHYFEEKSRTGKSIWRYCASYHVINNLNSVFQWLLDHKIKGKDEFVHNLVKNPDKFMTEKMSKLEVFQEFFMKAN